MYLIFQCDAMLTFLELKNIFSAAERGEISFVRYFLDQKIELNILNSTGLLSPLHLASGTFTIFSYLILKKRDTSRLWMPLSREKRILIFQTRKVIGWLVDLILKDKLPYFQQQKMHMLISLKVSSRR